VFYNEINNGLCNEYVLYFVNFIVELRISKNMEVFEFMYIIDNDVRIL
jgi:hypothetical protein